MYSQPYQEASKEIIRQNKAPGKLLKDTASLGLSVAGGGAILNRIAPFFNKFIPQDMAVKGLSKISSGLGKFIQGSLNQGHSMDDVMTFVKEKSGLSQEQTEQKEKPKENRNIIEQYSPELFSFLKEQVSGGRPVIESAAIAQNDKRFSDLINKLSKDHKTPWSSIVESVFGSGLHGGLVNPPQQNQQQQSIQGRQPFQGPGLNQQPPNQDQPQSNGLDPQLMGIMNDIKQKMQNLRGK